MSHISVPVGEPIEFVEIDPLKSSPLISKCKIKVCYVGEKPNRNGSIITREVAKEMAQSLPGAIIAGYYNAEQKDFEEHNREINISGGKFEIRDTTRPYGFVSMDAKPWFEWFEDDGVPHEYLMTEGYLWTGEYPECERVIEKGNNQSMELSEKFLKASWTKDDKGNPQFFIINEAIISKLCILGENVEPCFEGAQIQKEFALDEGFKKELFSLIKIMQENIKEGGAPVFTKYSVTVGDALWTALYSNIDNEKYSIDGVFEDGNQVFAVLQNREDKTFSRMNFSFVDGVFAGEELSVIDAYELSDEPQFKAEDIEAFEVEFKKKKEKDEEDEKKPPFLKDKEDDSEDKSEKKDEDSKDEKSDKKEDKSKDKKESDDSEDEEEDKKKKKKKYNLEEVEEYTELQGKYDELTTKFAALEETNKELTAKVDELTKFKNSVDRTAKEDLINNQFFMLDTEDKKDVIENIDTYSLDDIEAKLAVIAVRKKVNFSLEEPEQKGGATTFNLDGVDDDDMVPAWIKAVKATAKSMNE